MTKDALKRVRKQLQMTQAELAHELGVTRGSVARWENGTHKVPEMAAKLMERLVRERRPPERLR